MAYIGKWCVLRRNALNMTHIEMPRKSIFGCFAYLRKFRQEMKILGYGPKKGGLDTFSAISPERCFPRPASVEFFKLTTLNVTNSL